MTVYVNSNTSECLKKIAFKFGYVHGGDGKTGVLLDKIAALSPEQQTLLRLILEMS